jgi:hypothetical protein
MLWLEWKLTKVLVLYADVKIAKREGSRVAMVEDAMLEIAMANVAMKIADVEVVAHGT